MSILRCGKLMTRMPSLRITLAAAGVLAILAGGAMLRLADLPNRTMHCDEAVHGIKFGQLLEDATYIYDPHEYHGPALNYLTLPIARATGAAEVTEVTETQLRLVPALFGLLLVGLPWLLRREMGPEALLSAAALTALSPAMVFFSRYYIQEMLLVAFTLLAIVAMWRWAGMFAAADGAAGDLEPAEAGRARFLRAVAWLVVLGAAIGLMHATKETCVLALAAMVPAAAVTLPGLWTNGKRLALSVLLVVLLAAGVSALLFSSFGGNPGGIVDSYATYVHYLGQASGEGSAGRHVQPWHYYFHNLFWWPAGEGGFWSEGLIAALALGGLAASVTDKSLDDRSRRFARFLAIYTLLLALIYSAIPYKTPWCSLSFLSGMILLAGIGAGSIFRLLPGLGLKSAAGVVLAVLAAHLGWQAYQASFVHFEHPRNPYVYAHTTGDVPALVAKIRQIAAHHADATAMHVQAIGPDHDYWPLPWYLRDFSRVAWLDTIPEGPPAPVVITQPELEELLLRYLYVTQPPGHRNLYVPLVPPNGGEEWMLRPNVPLRAYVQLRLWETHQGARER